MQRENRYSASQHFVWREELSDILGEGAFGKVYRGVHKETGQPVAVKTFLKSGGRISQARELDILKCLQHPNIVTMIAMENIIIPGRSGAYNALPLSNSDSMQGKVLIMELCTEESLYANLERPENQFGLEEAEILLVLSHTTAGMEYLHNNKIIHRDWKPSNILKTIVDGQIFYKLSDFGAARVCEDGHFTSIVGTEEYLQPQIYRRALLGGSNGMFPATSDLWSIGVTYYQTISALLPFRPHGGRKNPRMMDKMTSEKDSGVISGYQEKENGPITWKRDLPMHCHVSSGLRPLVTKLLAGLLEAKPQLMWNYEIFFHEMDYILSKVVVKFYVLGEFQFRTVYLDRTADFYALQDAIRAQIDPSVKDYALFVGGNLLEADNWELSDYIPMQKSVVILVPLNGRESTTRLLGIPLEPLFIENSQPSLDWDADAAKTSLSVAYWIDVQLKIRRSIRQALVGGSNDIKVRLAQDFNLISQQWPLSKYSWSILQKHLKATELLYSAGQERKLLAPKHSSAVQITQLLAAQEREILNLKSQCMDFSKLTVPSMSSELENQEILAMKQTLVKMETIYTQFRKDKALRMDQTPDAHYHELKWHALQRKQLKQHWEWCKQKLSDEETERLRTFVRTANAYFIAAASLATNVAKAEIGLRNAEEIIREFGASLEKLPTVSQLREEKRFQQHAQEQHEQAPPANGQQQNPPSKPASIQSLDMTNSLLVVVREMQEMRGLMQENRQMLDRIQTDG